MIFEYFDGAPGVIKAHTEGTATDVLALIDQQPLGYAKKFNLAPSDAKGNAAVDLEVSLPMVRDLPLEKLRIGVQAKTTDLSVPIDARRRLEKAQVSFAVSTTSLTSQGTGVISGAPVTFKWTEDFTSNGNSTRVEVASRVDDTTRPALGLAQPLWLTGTIPATAVFTGRRFHFTEAQVKADLTSAVMELPVLQTRKEAGTQASGSGTVLFLEGGAMNVQDLVMTSAPILMRGGLQLDASGNVSTISLSQLRAGEGNEFAVNITPMQGGGYDIRMRGKV